MDWHRPSSHWIVQLFALWTVLCQPVVVGGLWLDFLAAPLDVVTRFHRQGIGQIFSDMFADFKERQRCQVEAGEAFVKATTKNPSRWMRAMWNMECEDFKQRRFVDITIIGSHDAGAYRLTDKTPKCGWQCTGCTAMTKLGLDTPMRWGIAQEDSILTQLRSGSRYFDFRLTMSQKSKCKSGWSFDAKSCWRFWHCFLGDPVYRGLRDLQQFLEEDAQDAQGKGEIVIVAMKLQYFASESPTKTDARVLSLLRLIDDTVGKYAYNNHREWWLQPLSNIIDSGRRLILVVFVGQSTISLDDFQRLGRTVGHSHESSVPVTELYTAAKKCGVKESQLHECENWQNLSAPFWGKYSDTCCDTSVVATKQKELQELYWRSFLHGMSPGEALRSRPFVRPLFVLYWTMTFGVRSLRTGNGTQLMSLREAAAEAYNSLSPFFQSSPKHLPVFANIIVGDFLSDTNEYLRVAALSNVLGLNSAASAAYDAKKGIVVAIICAMMLLVVGFVCLLQCYGQGCRQLAGGSWQARTRHSGSAPRRVFGVEARCDHAKQGVGSDLSSSRLEFHRSVQHYEQSTQCRWSPQPHNQHQHADGPGQPSRALQHLSPRACASWIDADPWPPLYEGLEMSSAPFTSQRRTSAQSPGGTSPHSMAALHAEQVSSEDAKSLTRVPVQGWPPRSPD